MITARDFISQENSMESDHPVAKSVLVLHKYLPQIWYAIEKNMGMIPISGDTQKIIKDLNAANLGYHLQDKFFIGNDLVQILRQFEKQSLRGAKLGQVQDLVDELFETISDYFIFKQTQTQDVEELLKRIHSLTMELSGTLSNIVFSYGSQISVQLQAFTNLNIKITLVKRAIECGFKLLNILKTLNAENLRKKAGGDPVIRSYFDGVLNRVVSDSLDGLYYSCEQLKAAQRKWEAELRERKRINSTVDAFFSYFASGNSIDAKDIDLSGIPEVACPSSTIEFGGYSTFDFNEIDEDFISFAKRCVDENRPRSNKDPHKSSPREIVEIEDGNESVIQTISEIELQMHFMVDLLNSSSEIHYLSCSKFYEVIDFQKEEADFSLRNWLEYIIITKNIDADGDKKFKDFELKFIGQDKIDFNGNFEINDILFFRKKMGVPA